MVWGLEVESRSQPMLKDQHLLAESEDLPVAIIVQQTKRECG